jgi:hypothetical protein
MLEFSTETTVPPDKIMTYLQSEKEEKVFLL